MNILFKQYLKFRLLRWYRKRVGKRLNLREPKTYNEKVQWSKLYDSSEIKSRLADKYLVRSWVEERIGAQYLIPLLGVYSCYKEIQFDDLPDQFVLKCNHGASFNIIVKDKSAVDLGEVKSKLELWMKTNFAYRHGFEMHYANIKRQILVEAYMENEGFDDLFDFKFWCFNGVVHYIEFLCNRNLGRLKKAFMNTDWKKQDFCTSNNRIDDEIPKPDNLDVMINLAETLSKGFPHVRVDFYRMNDGRIYFGEMTFSSASGRSKWSPPSADRMMGDLWDLPPSST